MKLKPQEIIFTEDEVNTMYRVLSPLYEWNTRPPHRALLIKSVSLIFEKFYGEVKVVYSDGFIDGEKTKVDIDDDYSISLNTIIQKMVDDEILSTSKAPAYDIDGNALFRDPLKTKPQTYNVYHLNKIKAIQLL